MRNTENLRLRTTPEGKDWVKQSLDKDMSKNEQAGLILTSTLGALEWAKMNTTEGNLKKNYDKLTNGINIPNFNQALSDVLEAGYVEYER